MISSASKALHVYNVRMMSVKSFDNATQQLKTHVNTVGNSENIFHVEFDDSGIRFSRVAAYEFVLNIQKYQIFLLLSLELSQRRLKKTQKSGNTTNPESFSRYVHKINFV